MNYRKLIKELEKVYLDKTIPETSSDAICKRDYWVMSQTLRAISGLECNYRFKKLLT